MLDWFTVGAQTLNFLILVWLMKRFLYKPILNAIDAREQRIAAELADADSKRAEAEQQRDEFQQKNTEFDQQRATLLSQATDEVQTERRRLLYEARQAADTLGANRQAALEREHRSLNEEITRRTREEVFAIARKTLMDLAGMSLEERMSQVFTRRLRSLDDEAKASLDIPAKTLSEPIVVRSAFDLPSEQQATIQQALNETFSAEIPVRFETAPGVISGIELTTGGRKVAWSIADYLGSLEESVNELLQPQALSQGESEGGVDPPQQPESKPVTSAEAT
jgi:F-type H+-transporting ATPase subunit b